MTMKKLIPATDYDAVSKIFHWLTVGLMAAQFVIAWTMPEIHRGVTPDTLINLHLSVGVAILLLSVARLIWRLSHPVPPLEDGGPAWQHRAAHATHGLIYLLLLTLPLMGWANASARGWTIDLFGMIRLPQILPTRSALGMAMGDIHSFSSYVLLALIGVHAMAALYHHVMLKDRTLLRMLPRRAR